MTLTTLHVSKHTLVNLYTYVEVDGALVSGWAGAVDTICITSPKITLDCQA